MLPKHWQAWASITSLGSLSQCLTTLAVKKYFLLSSLILSWLRFEPLPHILPLDPRENRSDVPLLCYFTASRVAASCEQKSCGRKGIFSSFLVSCLLAQLPSKEHWLLLAIPACSTWSDTVHMNTTYPLQPSAGSKPSLDACCAKQPGKPAEPGKDLITSHWGGWRPGGQSPSARCIVPDVEQRWWVSLRDQWRNLVN